MDYETGEGVITEYFEGIRGFIDHAMSRPVQGYPIDLNVLGIRKMSDNDLWKKCITSYVYIKILLNLRHCLKNKKVKNSSKGGTLYIESAKSATTI